MGYYSKFTGEFKLNKPLLPEHRAYLAAFAESRRMRRDNELLKDVPDPLREAVGLPLGDEGAYFIGETQTTPESEENPFGYAYKESIIDHNSAPGTPPNEDGLASFHKWIKATEKAVNEGKAQPGLWCEWIPSKDGTALLGPDEEAKFYGCYAWLHYLVNNFLEPWGYTITGEVVREGEDSWDIEKYIAKDNKLSRKQGKVTF